MGLKRHGRHLRPHFRPQEKELERGAFHGKRQEVDSRRQRELRTLSEDKKFADLDLETVPTVDFS